jgi:signal transduction histidine kinase
MEFRAIQARAVGAVAALPALPRQRVILFVFAVLICCGSIGNAEDGSEKPPRKWFEFIEEEAAKGQSVEFRGAVLCYDSGWGQFYVHDGSDTIYISPTCFTNRFDVGQYVAIKGDTTWSGAGTTLTNAAAAILGDQPLPQPVVLGLAEMAKSYGQWIEIHGQVRVAEASRDRVALILRNGAYKCLVYVMQTSGAEQFKNLADCWVKIQGINASRIENDRLNEAILFAPGMNQVKIITPSQSDRWQLPVTAIDTLLAQPPGDWTNQPIHVNGLASAYEPGSKIKITDPTGVLKAEVIQMNPVPPFQRIDAWGFLAIKTNQIVLSDAYFEIDSGSHARDASVAGTKRDARTEAVLTNIAQIRSLSKDRANENLPARIHGVLTCVDLDWRVVFLQDGHDAIFLDTGQGDLRGGQWVEVTGQTDGRGFAPQLINCSTRILGITNRPAVSKVDLQDVASGQLDSQWVEIEGVVRHVNKENGRIALTLAGPNGKFTAIVQDFNPRQAPSELIDSYISLRGACGSTVNSRGQISGITLHVPSREDVTIIDPSPSDPFAIAPTPIANVATFNTQRSAGRRIKVIGVVTLTAPGRTLFLQDASGGIRIVGAQVGQVRVGDRVEAVGFAAFSDFSPSLDDAILRRTETASLPAAKKAAAAQILQNGKFDGSLVEVQATLLEDFSAAQPKLVLQDGSILFTAEIALHGFHGAMPNLRAGSEVSVRGVCVIQGGEYNEPASFHVLLADTGGIVLIKGAPWWTPRHTMMLVGGTLLGVLLASFWVRSLRRQVLLQTEIIREEHQKLIQTSRQAGMAEVATNVLHNVGNVLNSINVSATMVDAQIKKSHVADVRRLAELLQEHSTDRVAFLTSDPKGQKVPDFIGRLAKELDSEQAAMLKEISSLRRNLEHVKVIVAMQQGYARVTGVFEKIKVIDLLEDTLLMDASWFARHDVEVVREYGVLPSISTDKHKVLQILINLVRNARHACDESGRSDKKVILRATRDDGRVKITVIDNGVGIPPENVTRIFNHGFTTRKDGHGFGLHSGALAAKELGGSLTAWSEGQGLGAAFTLELPVQHPAGNDTKIARHQSQAVVAAAG